MEEKFIGYPGISTGTNIGVAPIIPGIIDEGGHDSKLHSDRYEVFVNGDKVGNKFLLTQTDHEDDLASFLRDNGFEGFDYEVVGDHIEINTDDSDHHMKEILSSYLDIK